MKQHRTVSRIVVKAGVASLGDIASLISALQDGVLDYSIGPLQSSGSVAYIIRTIKHERVAVPTGIMK